MYYIFNKGGVCIGHSDYEPNIDDLLSRSETAVEYTGEVSGELCLVNGQIINRAPAPSYLHKWINGKWELDSEGQKQWVQQVKAVKLAEINAAAQAFIDVQTGASQVPSFELQTWSLQAAEAKAWDMDKSAATPVLDRIAASRGIDADKLKAAALRKTLAYEVLTAHVAGQRQALQSKVEAAKTVEALEKITVSFTGVDA